MGAQRWDLEGRSCWQQLQVSRSEPAMQNPWKLPCAANRFAADWKLECLVKSSGAPDTAAMLLPAKAIHGCFGNAAGLAVPAYRMPVEPQRHPLFCCAGCFPLCHFLGKAG